MKEMNENYEESKSLVIEGRNAVLEALRSGKPMDKLYVLDGCQDGPIRTIVREAKKHPAVCYKGTLESAFRDRKASGRDRTCGSL